MRQGDTLADSDQPLFGEIGETVPPPPPRRSAVARPLAGVTNIANRSRSAKPTGEEREEEGRVHSRQHSRSRSPQHMNLQDVETLISRAATAVVSASDDKWDIRIKTLIAEQDA